MKAYHSLPLNSFHQHKIPICVPPWMNKRQKHNNVVVAAQLAREQQHWIVLPPHPPKMMAQGLASHGRNIEWYSNRIMGGLSCCNKSCINKDVNIKDGLGNSVNTFIFVGFLSELEDCCSFSVGLDRRCGAFSLFFVSRYSIVTVSNLTVTVIFTLIVSKYIVHSNPPLTSQTFN